MSVPITPINLSSPIIGARVTVDWANVTSQSAAPGGSNPHIYLFNESQCEIQFYFPDGSTPFLPAGGWLLQELDPSNTSFIYQVVAVLASPQVSLLIPIWYGPNEKLPEVHTYGNAPIGGAVLASTANALSGVGQLQSLTETDGPVGEYILNPAPPGWPASPPAVNPVYLSLATIDQLGALIQSIVISAISGTPNVQLNGNVIVPSRFSNIHNELTAGNGVAVSRGAALPLHVTATTSQTVISYTPANTGMYFVVGWLRLNNGVSGNNITLKINYTDGVTVTGTQAIIQLVGTAGPAVNPNGATSIANGRYAFVVESVYAAGGNVVTVSYQDPTNTPADDISVGILQAF